MSLPVITRDEAEADIAEAAIWYERRSVGLGAEFVRTEGDRSWILLDDHPDHLAQSTHRNSKAKNQGNGKSLSFYLLLCVVGKILQPRRLSAGPELGAFFGLYV